MTEKKHNIVYKITNIVNDKIYIGIHETDDLDDGYMGSGKILKYAMKKYGEDKFSREILYDFPTHDEMVCMEKKIVDHEFVMRDDTYNLTCGGGSWFHSKGTVSVKDTDGNCMRVSHDDPRYLSGELKHVNVGVVTVKDEFGNFFSVSVDDPRYLSGELVHHHKNTVTVNDSNGVRYTVSIYDPRYLSGEFISIVTGTVSVKDSNGNSLRVSVDDPRYISGELKHCWVGKRHNEETKKKIGEANSKHQKGKKNSMYGMTWIYHLDDKRSIRVKKEDLEEWISQGWMKGRKIKW